MWLFHATNTHESPAPESPHPYAHKKSTEMTKVTERLAQIPIPQSTDDSNLTVQARLWNQLELKVHTRKRQCIYLKEHAGVSWTRAPFFTTMLARHSVLHTMHLHEAAIVSEEVGIQGYPQRIMRKEIGRPLGSLKQQNYQCTQSGFRLW